MGRDKKKMARLIIHPTYNGNDTYTGCAGNYTIINFTKKQYQISITSNDTLLKKGSTATVIATVRDVINNNNLVNADDIVITITQPDGTEPTYAIQSRIGTGTYEKTFGCDQEGTYTVQAKLSETTNREASTSNTLTITTGTMNTKLTLTSSDVVVTIGTTITLTATLKDNNNKPLKGQTIQFYTQKGTTPVASAETNSNGIATVQRTINNTIGTVQYQATYTGTGIYNNSSTTWGACNVISGKNGVVIQLKETTIYPNWKIRGEIRVGSTTAGIYNNPISSAKLKIAITSNNKTTTYDVYSNKAGYFETPKQNLTSDATVKISFTDSTGKFKNTSITQKVLVRQYILFSNKLLTTTQNASGVYNTSTGKRYRGWQDLNNLLSEDGKFAVCGSSCSDYDCIGTASGTWNRPAPLKLTNFQKGINENSTIKEISVSLRAKNVCCESGYNASILAPLIYYTNGTSKHATVNGTSNIAIPQTLSTLTATWTGLSLSATTYNKSSFYILVNFPSNTAAHTCRLYIDEISVDVKYVPNQT